MNVRSTALAAALAIAAAVPAAAAAAQVQTDSGCYQDNTGKVGGTVGVSGSGFDPDQPYSVSLDGQPLNTGSLKTGADGSIAGSIETPQLDGNAVHVYTLTVTEGANTATTTFSVTPFLADFTPGSGNPKTLHVRFMVFGFGLLDANPMVYLHYVRPNGKVKRTIRLGRAQGVCGQITHTARKKLFPFSAGRGTWRLQFDTHKRYRKGQQGVDFLYYTISVTIKKVFG
jgi:hypothetical protein